MAWLSGYGKRKSITITGQSGAGTNCQVNFSIGEDSGGDFSVPNSLAFPNDLRFTDNDQTTELDYWIEDLTVDPISCWVEVADDLGSNVIIYCYYGKSGDTTTSSISSTFIVGDDFEYDDAITNHGWSFVGGSHAVTSTDYAKTGTRSCKLYPDPAEWVKIARTISSTSNFAIAADYYQTNYTETSIHCGLQLFTYDVRLYNYENYWKFLYDAGWHDQTAISANGWYKQEIRKDGSTCKFYINDGLLSTDAADTNAVTSLGIGSGSTGTGWDSIRYWDNFRVRKFVSPEPAFSSAGEEESVPASSKAYSWGTIF